MERLSNDLMQLNRLADGMLEAALDQQKNRAHPSGTKKAPMNVYLSERRLSRRRNLTIPIRFRLLKSDLPEEGAQALNISECGVYFETRVALRQGTPVEIVLDMPQEITGGPVIAWRCIGHVVRTQMANSVQNLLRVGVRFDCYEVLHQQRQAIQTSLSGA